jgi:hypothetical protein
MVCLVMAAMLTLDVPCCSSGTKDGCVQPGFIEVARI